MPGSDDKAYSGDSGYDFAGTRDEQQDSSPPAAHSALRSFNTSNMPSFKDIEPFYMKHCEDQTMLFRKILETIGLTFSFVLGNASDISRQQHTDTEIEKVQG